jgi:hypothetical protein
LDDLKYFLRIDSENQQINQSPLQDGFLFSPEQKSDSWSFTVSFSKENKIGKANYHKIKVNSFRQNDKFWKSGGIIDFSQTEDIRAFELERRMVTSLYLTKINCQGSSFPQETGLTYNSWYGKPHMEMAWWHGVHFALWGRPEILKRQMSWYFRAEENAKKIAERQGFEGVRWQKMTDNNGQETPSSVGSGVIAAQERFDPKVTFNPTYELAYWRWALETAQNWRKLVDKPINQKWQKVLDRLSSLSEENGVYLGAESAKDSYSNPYLMTDHPSVLGAFGMLPSTKGLDPETMRNSLNKIWEKWHWDDTWGWDFPMTAMTATRLNMPEKAVDALLMPVRTNTYLKNGHNFQDSRLRLYLPGNGGFLSALALMAEGSVEHPVKNLGFPKDWKVISEGLKKML